MRDKSAWLTTTALAGGLVVLCPFAACSSSSGTRKDAGAVATAPAPVCGDGIVESGEDCDLGANNGMVGGACKSDCSWTCIPGTRNGNAECNFDQNACNGTGGTAICTPMHTCQSGPTLNDGDMCGSGFVCHGGMCNPSTCGDGIITPPKECDLRAGNGKGMGCSSTCMYDCVSMDSMRNCAPTDECGAQGTCNDTTHECMPGTPKPDGSRCGGSSGAICLAGVCTCTGTCHIVCGDGVRAGSEQCDDGNTTNLDGCDSTCQFEQLQRTTQLQFFGSTDSFCTTNALGAQAFTRAALGQIQAMVASDVTNALTNMIFKVMSATGQPNDLSGTSGPVVLGSLSGSVQYADAGAYSGNADVDWWYAVDSTMIDSSRNPLSTIPGTYTNKVLSAGPGPLTVKMNLSGSPAKLDLWNVRIQAAIGASTAPKVSTGLPPGHLASEHLAPGLTSFETEGVGPNGPTAEMCGNTRTGSFANAGVPAALLTGGRTQCDEGYTATSSLLDVLVNGCYYRGIAVINAVQPDQQDSTVMFPTGTKAPYRLSASGSPHVIDTCVDSSSTPVTVPIDTCHAGLGYSSVFRYQTDRVIVK
jgi:cysteine-rich repeat protein